jgi:hypothetical protein
MSFGEVFALVPLGAVSLCLVGSVAVECVRDLRRSCAGYVATASWGVSEANCGGCARCPAPALVRDAGLMSLGTSASVASRQALTVAVGSCPAVGNGGSDENRR